MIPYRDDNPLFRTPIVTGALIAANVLCWILVQAMGQEPALAKSVCELGLIPAELLRQAPGGTMFEMGNGASCVLGRGPVWYTPLTSMFLHGGWGHLIGNMWFLWLFGNNVEDSMGRLGFFTFYILSGLGAAALQVLLQPGSVLPMIGASGAISGILGAYIMLYPRVRVHLFFLLIIFPVTFTVPAFFMIGYWFLLQLLGGVLSSDQAGGVAFWAHVGGFLAGIVLLPLFRDPALVASHRRMAAWT